MSAINSNAKAFLDMFKKTMSEGIEVKPRGLPIKEIEDLQLRISPKSPFMGFGDRNYDVSYFKKEMIWKLGANKYDDSIKQHAKMWASVQNKDGTFYSNYGQYWFGEQQGFFYVISELTKDVYSRRAVIPMLSKEHLKPEVTDTVCTECIGFRIRNKKLNMSVHMRSSDQIYGLGTDIPTFSFLYRLVYIVLKNQYEWLEIGDIIITAMSSHIYSNHYEMVERIISKENDYYFIAMPWPETVQEAMYLACCKGVNLEKGGPLGVWLLNQ